MNLLWVIIAIQAIHIVLNIAEHFFMPKLYERKLLHWMKRLDDHEKHLLTIISKPTHYKF